VNSPTPADMNNTNFKINTEEFDRYATETVKLHPALFVVLYAGY
jgi:hypothetical protein